MAQPKTEIFRQDVGLRQQTQICPSEGRTGPARGTHGKIALYNTFTSQALYQRRRRCRHNSFFQRRSEPIKHARCPSEDLTTKLEPIDRHFVAPVFSDSMHTRPTNGIYVGAVAAPYHRSEHRMGRKENGRASWATRAVRTWLVLGDSGPCRTIAHCVAAVHETLGPGVQSVLRERLAALSLSLPRASARTPFCLLLEASMPASLRFLEPRVRDGADDVVASKPFLVLTPLRKV